MTEAKRGEVWITALDPVIGREQAKTRPALVLSADEFNTRSGLVSILPITGTHRPWMTRVAVIPPEGGLEEPSSIICEQVRTVSIQRLSKRMGTVSPQTLARASDIVRLLLKL